MQHEFSDADLRQLEQAGIGLEDAVRQLQILRNPVRGAELLRPATVGDGIARIEDAAQSDYLTQHRAAAKAGRWLKFTPASGAASRMFALQDDAQQARLCEDLAEYPFFEELRQSLQQHGKRLEDLLERRQHDEIVGHLLSSAGLGFAARPKGLLKFHRYPAGSRTAFAEHLYEAAATVRDGQGRCRLHFTIPPGCEDVFRAELDREAQVLEQESGVQLEVGFSVQEPSTDTLALDEAGQILRDTDDRIVLRPGGHGSLLINIQRLDTEFAFIKNIDNISHEAHAGTMRHWIQVLGGYLAWLQERVHAFQRQLENEPASADSSEILRFLRDHLNLRESVDEHPPTADTLARWLDRPLRVCGIVPDTGEPGGGPFWIRDTMGTESLQIVETSEMDLDREDQRQILARAEFFSPTFLAVGLRDHRGRPYRLADFVDDSRYILAEKQYDGRPARVLERPGLWNGSMAKWNSAYVEVPQEVFYPVKEVFDLLRPGHVA
jgi:hypothetical protein